MLRLTFEFTHAQIQNFLSGTHLAEYHLPKVERELRNKLVATIRQRKTFSIGEMNFYIIEYTRTERTTQIVCELVHNAETSITKEG